MTIGLGLGLGLCGRAGGGAAVFAPQDDASCICWFDTETGVTLSGADVTQWDDQSGNGRHATVPVGANEPTYTASNATYNNKGSVDFGAVAALRVTIPATDPVIIYIVGHSGFDGASVTNAYFFDFADAGNKKVLIDGQLGGQTGIALYDGSLISAPGVRFNVASLIATLFTNSGDDSIYEDDMTTAVLTDAAGNSAAGTSFTIGNFGAYGTSDYSLRGSIVALGIFDATSHDATKRDSFRDGLAARYGL